MTTRQTLQRMLEACDNTVLCFEDGRRWLGTWQNLIGDDGRFHCFACEKTYAAGSKGHMSSIRNHVREAHGLTLDRRGFLVSYTMTATIPPEPLQRPNIDLESAGLRVCRITLREDGRWWLEIT